MFLCGACNWLNWHYFSVGSDCQSWFVQKEASRHTDRMVYDYGQYRKKNCVRLRRTFNGSTLVRKLLHHLCTFMLMAPDTILPAVF